MLPGRTIFIGDVHGCYDELIELTEKIGLQGEDSLYFCGDLINKGPKSREVLEFVKNRPNTYCVLGNHEYFSFEDTELLLEKPLTPEIRSWVLNSVSSSTEKMKQLDEYKNWVLTFPKYIETEDWILLHGGIDPYSGLDTPTFRMTTIRELDDGIPWYEAYTGSKPIIYGHWAADGLRIRPHTIGLDTGCVFGGHLTAFCFETKEIWQVHAHNMYKIPADMKGKVQKV